MVLRKDNVAFVEAAIDKSHIQVVYRFPNGYGASIVRTKSHIPFGRKYSSYTDDDDWELAVLRFRSDDNRDYNLDYSTPITSDVLGYQSDDEVNAVLEQIGKLSLGLPEPSELCDDDACANNL
jgi:hypothetical protein